MYAPGPDRGKCRLPNRRGLRIQWVENATSTQAIPAASFCSQNSGPAGQRLRESPSFWLRTLETMKWGGLDVGRELDLRINLREKRFSYFYLLASFFS